MVPKTCDQKKAVEKQSLAPKKKSQPKILQDEEKAWVVQGDDGNSFVEIARRVP